MTSGTPAIQNHGKKTITLLHSTTLIPRFFSFLKRIVFKLIRVVERTYRVSNTVYNALQLLSGSWYGTRNLSSMVSMRHGYRRGPCFQIISQHSNNAIIYIWITKEHNRGTRTHPYHWQTQQSFHADSPVESSPLSWQVAAHETPCKTLPPSNARSSCCSSKLDRVMQCFHCRTSQPRLNSPASCQALLY